MILSPCLPRSAHVLLHVVAVLLLAGCALTHPAPVKQTFLLEVPQLATASAPRPGSLRVGIVTVAGAFRDRQFVVRESDQQFSTDYYHEFITPPAPMLAEVTARSLAHAGVFARVGVPGSFADADFVLDGFVNALYVDHRTPNDTAAQLSITFYLSQADRGSSVPFWTRTYDSRVALRVDEGAAYAQALNAALGDILADLAKDLATVPLPPALPR